MGMVEPSMTRTDQTDTDRTDLLPTRTYVVPDIDTTEDIEPTDTKDTFTPPTKVISETFSRRKDTYFEQLLGSFIKK